MNGEKLLTLMRKVKGLYGIGSLAARAFALQWLSFREIATSQGFGPETVRTLVHVIERVSELVQCFLMQEVEEELARYSDRSMLLVLPSFLPIDPTEQDALLLHLNHRAIAGTYPARLRNHANPRACLETFLLLEHRRIPCVRLGTMGHFVSIAKLREELKRLIREDRRYRDEDIFQKARAYDLDLDESLGSAEASRSLHLQLRDAERARWKNLKGGFGFYTCLENEFLLDFHSQYRRAEREYMLHSEETQQAVALSAVRSLAQSGVQQYKLTLRGKMKAILSRFQNEAFELGAEYAMYQNAGVSDMLIDSIRFRKRKFEWLSVALQDHFEQTFTKAGDFSKVIV